MDEVKVEHRLSQVEDRAKSNSRRLDGLEKQHGEMSELVKSVATIAQKQVDMEADFHEVKTDIKRLLATPGKRWESVVTAGIGTAIGALLTLIFR